MSGQITDSNGTFEIGGIENRIRFLLRPFANHPLYESCVKAILEEFKRR